jgi:hypothetical protein
MPISLNNPDNTTNIYALYDRMAPGEVYSPDANGTGGVYQIPERRMVADPSGQINDLQPFQQQTGVLDAMVSRTADADAARLADISAGTGAEMRNAAGATTFNPSAVDRFNKLSAADQMAAEMVQSGRMSPKDFYAISKKAEVDTRKATLDYLSRIDPGRNQVDLMQGGKSVPTSAANVQDAMSNEGSTSFDVGAPYPNVGYTYYHGDTNGSKQNYKQMSDLNTAIRNDSVVKSFQQVYSSAANVRDLLQSGNKMALKAIGAQIARMGGDRGALSEQEQQWYQSSQAIFDKLAQSVNTAATGRFTEENKKSILDMLDIYVNTAKGYSNQRLDALLKGHSAVTGTPVEDLQPIAEAYGYNPAGKTMAGFMIGTSPADSSAGALSAIEKYAQANPGNAEAAGMLKWAQGNPTDSRLTEIAKRLLR